ncbi:Transposase OrfA [Moritella viscosa]|nr:Transposase OrfA [Moritella viscosa]SGZ13316.1 Transposase OrfA [Moritella viscosa]SHO14488.1 Transposase OrfA [Moritella viscosa]SHO27807.1 Transposase OrfA [Moritella viscosa]
MHLESTFPMFDKQRWCHTFYIQSSGGASLDVLTAYIEQQNRPK